MHERGEGKVDAVVLAGQRNDGALRDVSSVPFEGDIPIAGRPMIDWVLDALIEAHHIDRIMVVGPETTKRPNVIGVPMREGLLENVMAGVTAVQKQDRVLVVTGDIPLITGRVVDALVEAAPPADLVYPVVERSCVEQFMPGVRRTYVRLRDGVFTGGNVFFVNPAIMPQVANMAQVLLAHRKSPIRLAQDIGWGFLLKLFSGRLTLAIAEQRVSEVLGVVGRVLVAADPEVGVDVDKVSDWEMVSQVLLERHQRPIS